MKNVLITDFGFRDNNFQELHNEAAIRDAMLAAMNELVDKAKKDDSGRDS